MKALLISDNTELKTAITRVCSAQHPVITTLTALPTMLRGGGLVTAMTPDIVFLDASASQSLDITLCGMKYGFRQPHRV